MASAAADREAQRREHNEQKELESLRRVFEALDRNKVGKVGFKELNDQLVKLDYRAKRVEVEDMIWEVDEDCDHHVSWDEFKLMFHRCRNDRTGLEPRKLFNVVEFMMHDKDSSGTIDMDECMEILFRRFGKEQLEARVNEFMTNDEDADKEISFTEFLHMDQKNDIAGTSKHPGFRLSAGMIATTKQENERLLRQMGVKS